MDLPIKGYRVMSSHENKIHDENEKNQQILKNDRLNIPILTYFWQSSPLAGNRNKTIPKFIRSIKVFEHFSDYELKLFTNFLHQRTFQSDEIVIEEGDNGFGFYIILDGTVDIYSKRTKITEDSTEQYQQFITRLTKYEYFGELALLEKQSVRNATAISKGGSTLLAIYKPDLEELIDRYPVIGSKFLLAISLIVARRFGQVTEELKTLKEKIQELESKIVPTDV